MKENKFLQVVCLTITILLFSFLMLVSPYKYSWDEELRQPNPDSIDVINFFSPLVFLFLAFGLFFAKGSKRWVFVIYGIIAIVMIARLVYINALPS